MRRRDFITLVGGAAAWPVAARAQQLSRTRRIGFLSSYTEEAGRDLVGCFRKGLEQLGWIEGKNISIEYRWVEGRSERNSILATELTRLNLDLIACNSTPATQALQRATRDVPIVFMAVSDPVASGIVASLARPQANITGVSNYQPATAGKLLELLKTAIPDASRVLILRGPDNAGKTLEVRELEASGPRLGVTIQAIEVRNADEIERAFMDKGRGKGVAIVTLTDGVTVSNRERIVELAMKSGVPAIYQTRDFVDAGGLVSYGLNICQHFRSAATYVDKILKGAKPTDLPVELPRTFELIINLKTAKALGLTVPPKLLFTADEVIE
jgi:putative ABC transport system substrate-binding protein